MSFSLGSSFHCPNVKCSGTYIRYSNYLKHLQAENCFVKIRNESQINQISRIWMSKHGGTKYEKKALTQQQKRHMRTNISPLSSLELPPNLTRKPHNFTIVFNKGWAISVRAQATVYTTQQCNFAKRLWLHGNETNEKVTPLLAVTQMRDANQPHSDEPLFHFTQWLNENNFKYLFSKYTAMAKKQKPVLLDQIDQEISEDLIEDEIAESVVQARVEQVRNVEDSLANLEPVHRQSHPLIVKLLSICDLANDWKAKNGSPSSKLFSYEDSKIFSLVSILSGEKFEGNMTDAANFLYCYVKKNCICINNTEAENAT